jgi:hypothetical protein
LKRVLAGLRYAVIVAVIVRMAWLHLDDLYWELSVLPGAIALLA